jgi:hypothetical protein
MCIFLFFKMRKVAWMLYDSSLLHEVGQAHRRNGGWDQIITCCHPLFLNSATELKNAFWSWLHQAGSNFPASHTSLADGLKNMYLFLAWRDEQQTAGGWCYKCHIPCREQRHTIVCPQIPFTVSTHEDNSVGIVTRLLTRRPEPRFSVYERGRYSSEILCCVVWWKWSVLACLA